MCAKKVRALNIEFTVVSLRHLDYNERMGLAAELTCFNIQHVSLSRAQLVMNLCGHDVPSPLKS